MLRVLFDLNAWLYHSTEVGLTNVRLAWLWCRVALRRRRIERLEAELRDLRE